MDPKVYQENIATYSRISPNSAQHAANSYAEGFFFCQTKSNEQNLGFKSGEKEIFFHSNYSPSKEADRWFAKQELENINVLYVYGVGLGYYYEAAKVWLDERPDRYLVFLEDNPAVLKCLLHTNRATEMLKHPQVQLHFLQDLDQAGQVVLNFLSWCFILMSVEVTGLEHYQRSKRNFFDKLSLRLLHQVAHDGNLAKEYLFCNELFFLNFYHNLLLMKDIYHGNRLFDKFKGVPAIICGAGPSLDKDIEALKKWKQKALIFAGGSSINSLGKHGFHPHFGGGIDPNKVQLTRARESSLFNVPMFYRNRWHRSALQHSTGPRLYLNGCGGYSVATWFEKQLDIEGKAIEEGHNVINFLVEVASHLGCDPIIFVGLDLAFTDGRFYADGIRKSSIATKEYLENFNVIYRKDVHGEQIPTLRKWVVESDWLASYTKQCPGSKFINATCGGLGIEGVENRSLQEIDEEYAFPLIDTSGLANLEVQQAKVSHIRLGNVLHSMQDLAASLTKCVDICEKLDKELQKSEKKIKKAKAQSNFSANSVVKNLEEKLLGEPAYKYILEELNSVRLRMLQRKLDEACRDKNNPSKTAKNLESIKINQERLFFLKQVAKNNLYTMQKTVEDFAGRGYDVKGFKAI